MSFLILLLLLLPNNPSSSLPLCTDLRAPYVPKEPLTFCPYHGRVCCDSAKDFQLQKQFEAMNISDSGCGSLVKSMLCSICDQFSAELFKLESGPQPVPPLCNSSTLIKATKSHELNGSFCSIVWDICQNVPILNSPFVPHSLEVRAEGLCLEKIGNGAYLNMVAHPDGSNHVFFSEQSGKIWLANIPEQESGDTIGLEDESSPFVDLTGEVYYDGNSFGLMGMAFHPNFSQNGRFFASFICDKVKSPGCSGRCSCNEEVNCYPWQLTSSGASQPCRFHKVIAEFSANETALEPSLAESPKPLEVRRIFTLGLPFPFSHGGQILFGPRDGYLYVMTGDSGEGGDPLNFSQNKKSLLGKILRLDIDNMPSTQEIGDLGLWGNYSVPKDNPFTEDKELLPEIWALGLRNPWRCSFDSQRPLYFICADTGQDQYEEVDIITKGGNYGWPIYEGPLLFKPQQYSKAGNNVSSNSTNIIFPVLGYSHFDVNKNKTSSESAAISGGYFYRSATDPCMFGRYLYADLYGSSTWTAMENPKESGNFTTTRVSFSCAEDSPLHCNSSLEGNFQPDLGYVYSFAEDNRKDIVVLASSGVYRVVDPNRCGYTCSKENVVNISSPSSSSYGRNQFADSEPQVVFFLSTLLLFLVFAF